jgi:hypothetical protein
MSLFGEFNNSPSGAGVYELKYAVFLPLKKQSWQLPMALMRLVW